MPLNTQVLRDGKTRSIRWGQFHVACMVIAAAWDSGVGPYVDNAPPGPPYPDEPQPVNPSDTWELVSYPRIAQTPLNEGQWTLQGDHRFLDTTDGEVFELLAGDVLKVWRD